jgi:Lsr2
MPFDRPHSRVQFLFGRRSAIVCSTQSRFGKGIGVAKETVTRLIDDLDGGEAQETVTFGLDGSVYRIDLSTKNAKRLRSELATYVDKGTRVSGRIGSALRGAARPRGSVATDRQQNQAIREWAIRKGRAVAPRGRIKQEIVDEYHKTAGR